MTDIQRYIDDPNVATIYRFGSHVYGTNNAESDEDYIVVARVFFDSRDINVHVYSREQFRLLIDRHDIQAMECMFLPKKHVLKEDIAFFMNDPNDQYPGKYVCDKARLRVAVSTIASNSWVKGKKKLTVAGDYDMKLGIKSVFHSLRILDFGIQMATHNRIIDYGSMNWLMEDLRKLAAEFQREELWRKIDDKYRSMFNEKSSMFKSLAPKDVTEINRKAELRILLLNTDLIHFDVDDLVTKITNIFEK